MPTAIQSNTFAGAMEGFNGRKLDRNQDGTLWACVYDGNSGNAQLSYSKDSGATWINLGTAVSTSAGPGIAQATRPAFFIDQDDHAHLVFKQNAASSTGPGGARTAGYLYYMRGTPNAARTAWTWSTAQVVSDSTQHDYTDVVACRTPGTSTWDVFIVAAGLYATTNNVASYLRLRVSADGTTFTRNLDGLTVNTQLGNVMGQLGGPYGASSHTYPSIDFNHTGDGKTVAGGTPHLYVGWTAGATGAGKGVRFRKAVYAAGAWTWNAEREIDSTRAVTASSGTWLITHFDGTRAVLSGLMAASSGVTTTLIHDRDGADTTTTTRLTLGSGNDDVLISGSATYDGIGNVYLFGRDNTSPRKVNRRKWTRATATLGPIEVIDPSANAEPFISARRGYSPGSSIEAVWTDGTASPYTVQYDRLALNVAPNAPTLTSPVGNASIDRAVTNRFTWTFSDPDTGDTQSKFDLQYWPVDANGTRTASGTVVSGTTTSQFVDLPANTFAAGRYEYQVRTYDAAGTVGPYSASEYFTAANAPAGPTITDPTNGGTIGASSYTVTWSAAAQDAYQVRTVADNAGSPDPATVYTDTGTVEDPAGRARTVAFATNNRTEHVQVRVRSGGLWSTWANARVLVSFTPPATPTLTVTALNTVGAGSGTDTLRVTVTNPAPAGGQPTVTAVDLLRRPSASGGTGLRVAAGLPPGAVFNDRLVASGVDYQYAAVAIAGNGTTSTSAWTG